MALPQNPLELTTLSVPIAGFKGPTSKSNDEKETEEEERKGAGGEERERRGMRGGKVGASMHFFTLSTEPVSHLTKSVRMPKM